MLLFNYAGATIVALVIFLIIYSIRPVLITQSNRVFACIVVAEIIGLLANILSAYADNNGDHFYKPVLIILNNIYYISYIARYLIFTYYFISLLQIRKKRSIVFIIPLTIVAIVSMLVLSSSWNDVIYSIKDNNVFSPGKYVICIYISNAITILVDLYIFLLAYKKLNSKDKIGIILAIFILLSCCFIDFIFIDYVISDIFFILEVLIIYLMFENPDIYYDKRTNILNFQAFSDSLKDNIFRHKNCSIISFEIQTYSQIKELYGANQIDLVLNEIGTYLKTNYRTKNSFYLQNGKFAIITTFIPHNRNIKKEIEDRFNKPWELKNNTQIVISINLIDLNKTIGFDSFGQIESCMEQASNELKKNSKNEIIINEAIYQKVMRKTKILKILINALSSSSIIVYFQPIVDSKTQKVIAAEALARLYDEELGLIPPDEFISIAEENGYIERIGEEILEKVCECIEKNNLEEMGIRWINVNLSPIQCQNHNLINIINSIINKHNVSPSLIHFEITEESMIDKKILTIQINKLIESGYKLSLDDFGTGFSNFYSIKAFDFCNIKLDMSLVNDHFNHPDNLLPGIIKIFKDRNLSITAEGIETKEMAELFGKMGCNYLQGYYYSKPINEKDFLALIKK